uniref:class I SAM-dependent methyltransferase n=1 Tax=Marinimicrobium alkaliphilum TaxID=2202654 RepID=UPI0018E065C1
MCCPTTAHHSEAQALATQLGLDFYPSAATELPGEVALALLCDAQGWALQPTGCKAPGAVRVDFAGGAVDHRRRFGGGKGQMIAKAVGLKAGVYPRVLDATAGLGRDAFVLASLGCQVELFERSPVVATLLADGLARAYAEGDSELRGIVARMTLHAQDARSALADWTQPWRPDVVYLDPMFPERQKSAQVKKEMALFHDLVGRDDDAGDLLAPALALAHYRVVVKRPRKAPFLAGVEPGYQLAGKTSRYDIYPLKALPAGLNAETRSATPD